MGFLTYLFHVEERGSLGHGKTTGLSNTWFPQGPSAFKGVSAGRIHTYIKDDGRGWSQTPDADVGEHFEHMAFPARHVHKSEKAIGAPVGGPASCCTIRGLRYKAAGRGTQWELGIFSGRRSRGGERILGK